MVVARITRLIGKRKHRDCGISCNLSLWSRARERDDLRRRRTRFLDDKDLDRLRNILQTWLAKRAQSDPRHVAHRLADRRGDEDRVRFGEGLDPRGHIDGMDMKVRCIGRHFAKIKTDTKLDRVAVIPYGLVAKLRLNLDGESERPVGAVEQGEDSVAGDIGYTAPVVADQ